jgi:hypothetical protein
MRVLIFLGCLITVLVAACEPVTPTLPPPTSTPITPVIVLATFTPTPTATPPPVSFPTGGPNPTLPATAVPSPVVRAVPVLPVVQLASPAQNAQISLNQTYTLVILASSENGIARIEVTDDGVPVRVENPNVPAPTFTAFVSWTPSQIGPHILRAVAYDVQNRASAPDEVTVTVLQDARKPTSIIVFPIGIPQIELGGVLSIYGVATDESGVTQVELWANNQAYAYLAATNITGTTALPFVFNWHALTPGTHNFFVRAYDNQNQTTDSAPLRILVVDNQAPSMSVAFDRTNAPAGEPIVITASAVDVSGIQKIEFISGREILGTLTSPSAARQTSMTGQIVYQNPNPGEYTIIVRVHNANGNVKESSPQTVSILRPGQSAPTAAPTLAPTRTRTPRATVTPRSQPPPAPKAEIVTPADRFNLSAPLRVTFSGQASAELERIELLALYPGQTIPQLVCAVDARASTQKTGQCDWTPPLAGIVTLYAQAIDSYRQVGKSPAITGFAGAPALPTATPTPLTASARWNAATSTGPATITLRQTGTTLRGDVKMAGIDSVGRIISGTARADRLSFSVDFSTEGATPTAGALTMDFDCVTDLNAGTMSCTYRDSRGRTGAALFRRETNP